MALVSMRQRLDHAAEHGYGLPAFNVNNLEQVQAIMSAAAETDRPVIYEQFGCAGMASRIEPMPLPSMAGKYRSGELRQVVN